MHNLSFKAIAQIPTEGDFFIVGWIEVLKSYFRDYKFSIAAMGAVYAKVNCSVVAIDSSFIICNTRLLIMTFEQLFSLANIYILPFWTLMVLLPNWNLTKKIIGSYLYFIPLIGLYIYYLAASFDPDAFAALANPTLSDIATFFSLEGAAGAGWVHFLVMDLFIGRWIYWQGQEKKIWTIHSLILCLFFGPIGLLSHILTAYIFTKESSEKSQIDTAIS